jgi:Branched-chain amino acid transport protein (AzlD)
VSDVVEVVGVYGVIALVAVLAHEPWRWFGLLLGRNVSVDSEIFLWVRAVATALVAGLVFRLILFPAGAMAHVPISLRLAALGGAIGIFFLCGRHLGAGVAGGAGLLIAEIVFLK